MTTLPPCPLQTALGAELADLETNRLYLADLVASVDADAFTRAELLLLLAEINEHLAAECDRLAGLLDDHPDLAETLDAAGPAEQLPALPRVRSLARRAEMTGKSPARPAGAAGAVGMAESSPGAPVAP